MTNLQGFAHVGVVMRNLSLFAPGRSSYDESVVVAPFRILGCIIFEAVMMNSHWFALFWSSYDEFVVVCDMSEQL